MLTLAASLLLAQFLTHYYETYPEKKPTIVDVTRSPAGAAATPVEIEDDGKPSPPDVIPEFPNLRLSKAPVMQYFTINSDVLQEAGPKSGQFAAEFQCMIVECDGRSCGKTRKIFHKRCRAVSTTNLIHHIRERAAVCNMHKEALTKIEAASTNFIEIEGDMVSVYNFREAFKYALRTAATRARPPPVAFTAPTLHVLMLTPVPTCCVCVCSRSQPPHRPHVAARLRALPIHDRA